MGIVVREVAGGAATLVSRGPFNCYIVHGDEGPLIVDPGLPSTAGRVCEEVGNRYGSRDFAGVVCTHGHTDHVAGVEVVLANASCGYHLPAACEAWLRREGPPPTRPGARQVAKIAPVLASQPFDPGALRELAPLMRVAGHTDAGMVMPVAPVGFLADGDAVAGAPGWTVLHTPGHVADSTCLYHEATATMLSGDTVLTHEGSGWFNPEITDDSASAVTEERLRSIPVEHLLPGHGLPVSGTDLLGRARGHRQKPERRGASGWIATIVGDWAS